MKKSGIINAELMYELTSLRHTDKMVICDAGYPIPRDAVVVDVSLKENMPRVMNVLPLILNEIIVEKYVIFDLAKQVNQPLYKYFKNTFTNAQECQEVSMSEFQKLAEDAKFYIRTGDVTPCANILLVSASGVHEMCDPQNIEIIS